MSSSDSQQDSETHCTKGLEIIKDETIGNSNSEENLTNEDGSDTEEEDDDIFVPEGSYAQLDDEEANTAQLPDIHEPGDHANVDLDRILDERINAEMVQRQFKQEKSKTEEIQAQERNANTNANHSNMQLVSPPIEVDIYSSKQKAMPAEHVQQIKDIMAGIQLSDAAIPEWAKRIPERAWMPGRKQQPEQSSSPRFTDVSDPTTDPKDSTS
ncbi:hypothetical protein IW140_005057 [Coemansia sp. RSA 1813]|nr:hypothetical protein EV178_002210 [Coemansia sp. RSA 1646]KAJ1769250.1 hypothetical protein LPJ74_004186 [Coemansia sp. RSA 1843]KAJ2090290.1 hypothetical protein IW138_002715 [Coemansia sp. RSA 986]KAJ2215480.1 hypothetical protein EV179_002072 [Coemansia sp. RSA 487]KAJ2566075.1 hypothetical protein IW140_005057 [Coemansia sp. RSA 1813]